MVTSKPVSLALKEYWAKTGSTQAYRHLRNLGYAEMQVPEGIFLTILKGNEPKPRFISQLSIDISDWLKQQQIDCCTIEVWHKLPSGFKQRASYLFFTTDEDRSAFAIHWADWVRK